MIRLLLTSGLLWGPSPAGIADAAGLQAVWMKEPATTMGTRPGIRLPLLLRTAAFSTTAVAVAAAILTGSAPTAAQPQPTISQVRQKIDALTSREDQLGQRLDQVTQELAAAHQRLAAVSAQVAHYRSQFQTMRTEIGQMAAYAYEDGTTTSPVALLTSGDPQRILSQSSFLIQLSSSQHQRMETFIAAARRLAGAQRTLRRTEAGVATLKRQIASQKAGLTQLISRQRSILAHLTAQQRAAAQATSIGAGGTTAAQSAPATTAPAAATTQAQKAVAFAYAQLGKPYVWGATGPNSYDCSGLVMAAWAAAGVSIPRDSYAQWAGLPHVPTSSLQPGDILFFASESHVGLYVGNNMLIDAPQPGESVEKVSLSSSWYAANLDGAARP